MEDAAEVLGSVVGGWDFDGRDGGVLFLRQEGSTLCCGLMVRMEF